MNETSGLVTTLIAGLLLPLAAGWLLARITRRAIAATIVAALALIAGVWMAGYQIGIAYAAIAFALAWIAAAPGFVPASLRDVADTVTGEGRRWWK